MGRPFGGTWRSTRSFLSAAESVFRTHRDDAGFDLSGAAVSYAKAVETELNAMLFPAMARVLSGKAPHEREVREDGRLLDLGATIPHQTLGTIRRLLEHQPIVQSAVREATRSDHSWVLGVLPRELAALIGLRNAGAHSEATGAEALAGVRRVMLGIGREGLLEKVVRVRMRAG